MRIAIIGAGPAGLAAAKKSLKRKMILWYLMEIMMLVKNFF